MTVLSQYPTADKLEHTPYPMREHAVARLRSQRLARSAKPFLARGSRAPRCPHCRVKLSHCLCAFRPEVRSGCGMCLIMGDIEALKPSNTGWLVADLIADTFAFAWSRVAADDALLCLLKDPQWQVFLVFPGHYAQPERVVQKVVTEPDRRPLFVLLDGTWAEARKMFKKSPYLNHLPVLSLTEQALSHYGLRQADEAGHLCTAEVAAACVSLAGEEQTGATLQAYLQVFTRHYMAARRGHLPPLDDATHHRLHTLVAQPDGHGR